MSAGRFTSEIVVLAGSLSDSEATRRVFFAAGGLVVLGLGLLVATIWWWRSTRSEHPSLAPLEMMGARRWGKVGDAERKRLVDSVRPDGAQPLSPGIEMPVPADLSLLAAAQPVGFDDLREIDAMLGAIVDAPAEPVLVSAAEGLAVDDEPAEDVKGSDDTSSIVGEVNVVNDVVDDAVAVADGLTSVTAIDPLLQSTSQQE